mmetsp:Transcript_34939/g.70610  ORF Transcript_34939/g.70610 Transcript_34939/m.70610 type:complete len:103 (+) Transcript_34939:386-694(+)
MLLPIFFWSFSLVAVYLFARFIYNIRVKQMMLDWEAVPHIRLVRFVGASIMIFAHDFWEGLQQLAPEFSERAERTWERIRPSWTRSEYRPVQHSTTTDEEQY